MRILCHLFPLIRHRHLLQVPVLRVSGYSLVEVKLPLHFFLQIVVSLQASLVVVWNMRVHVVDVLLSGTCSWDLAHHLKLQPRLLLDGRQRVVVSVARADLVLVVPGNDGLLLWRLGVVLHFKYFNEL